MKNYYVDTLSFLFRLAHIYIPQSFERNWQMSSENQRTVAYREREKDNTEMIGWIFYSLNYRRFVEICELNTKAPSRAMEMRTISTTHKGYDRYPTGETAWLANIASTIYIVGGIMYDCFCENQRLKRTRRLV